MSLRLYGARRSLTGGTSKAEKQQRKAKPRKAEYANVIPSYRAQKANQMSDSVSCATCGKEHWGAFVEHGSYVLFCHDCKTRGPCTSWLAAAQYFTGRYRAFVLNKQLERQECIAEGAGPAFIGVVSQAASSGKIVELYEVLEFEGAPSTG